MMSLKCLENMLVVVMNCKVEVVSLNSVLGRGVNTDHDHQTSGGSIRWVADFYTTLSVHFQILDI